VRGLRFDGARCYRYFDIW